MSVALPFPRTVPRAEARSREWPWQRSGLVAILLLSGLLELWHLNQLGTANNFYAAAVLSMTQNFHAFFFNSLDSVGFVTIDKPPLGFWVQAISAKLLGFSGFSILLPEALATIGSVAIVYYLVKRAFDATTGLLAGLMLAVVPISVLVGRNNTIDALLVFTLLAAVWTGLKATERGNARWLLITGAIVGLGFEIKMLEAYLVVPALSLLYLLGAPVSRKARLAHLAAAGAVMLAVSLAWPLAVDLTPANLRPFVDSTQDNSAISLALGYNGIQRLLGQNASVSQFLSGTTNGAGGMFNNGAAGPLRLFDLQLAGQASWLLPLSLVGMLLGIRLPITGSRQRQTALVFGMWLLTAGAFFSVASFFHSYYLVTLGPPIAALAAIGITQAWSWPRRVVLAAVLLGTAAVQAYILGYYPTWSTWLTPIVLAASVVGSAVLGFELLRRSPILARAGSAIAIAAILIAPTVWSVYSTVNGSNGGIPSAGPQIAGQMFGGPPAGFEDGRGAARDDGSQSSFTPGQDGGPGGGQASASVTSYLETNQGAATYLVATTDSQTAATIILASEQPVMSLGGFTGSDPILSVDQFTALVESGEVRFVLASGGGPQSAGSSQIMAWVKANGTPVTIDGQSTQLYDLSALQTA